MLIYERWSEREGGGEDDIMQLATSRRGDIHSLCVCLNKSLCAAQLYDTKTTSLPSRRVCPRSVFKSIVFLWTPV